MDALMVKVVKWTGWEARALREARRMSLRAFAAHLGLARGSVVNWERRGELARLRPETQEILDRDLSLADEATRTRFEATIASDDAGHRRPAEVSTDAGGMVELDHLAATDGSGQPAALNLGFRGSDFAAAGQDWLLARLDPTSCAPPRLTTGIAAVVRDTFAAFQELDTKYGGAHAHPLLVQYLRTQAIPLLNADGSDVARRATFYAVAETAYLAGLTAFDCGACGLAQRYYTYALRLSQEAEDDGFAANILAAMAHLANSHGNGREAVQLARTGLVAASRVANQALAMRLNISLARGYAIDAAGHDCVQAVAAAERALDLAVPREQRWTRFLDEAYLSGEMALCFLDLGQPRQAERFALRAIELHTGRQRRLVLSHAVLATARSQFDDREGAEAALSEALDFTGHVQSSRALRAIGEATTAIRKAYGKTDGLLARASAVVGPRAAGACCPRVPVPSASRQQ
jgi:transcriptional regulator with XRE-family HTH domain/tetratricopeptide (TPR) repeat protein